MSARECVTVRSRSAYQERQRERWKKSRALGPVRFVALFSFGVATLSTVGLWATSDPLDVLELDLGGFFFAMLPVWAFLGWWVWWATERWYKDERPSG